MNATHLIAAMAIFCSAVLARGQDDAKTILGQGLFAEEAELDLEKAAKLYERLIAGYDEQRNFAVAALYRLAEVRRRQERNADAAKLYQRIVEEFPKADPHARLSRENLKAMGIAMADEKKARKDPDEEKELRRLAMLAENNPDRIWDQVPHENPGTRSRKSDPLSKAARLGRIDVLTWMLDHAKETGRDVSEELDGALSSAASVGKLEPCKVLHARGANISATSGLLARAIAENHDDVAKWLAENGTDLNAPATVRIPTTLYYSEVGKDRDSAPFFASVALSPLATAIAEDDKYWVDWLFEKRVDVNASSEHHAVTALMIACWKGHGPLVKKLLESGADPNAADTFKSPIHFRPVVAAGVGWTPLHYGAGNLEIVRALLGAGAIPAASERGVSPLHCACYLDATDSIGELLKVEGETDWVNATAKFATAKAEVVVTPLVLSAFDTDAVRALKTADALIAAGADPLAKDSNGLDVFDLCPDVEICAALLRKYAYPNLHAKRAISLAFPAVGARFESHSAGGEDGESPPTFAEAVQSLRDGEHNIRGRYEFAWESPVLVRSRGDGTTETEIDVLAEGGYPVLEWGDVIEFRLTESQREKATRPRGVSMQRYMEREFPWGVRKLRKLFEDRRNRDPREKGERLVMPGAVSGAISASQPAPSIPVTVVFPGEEPRSMRVQSGRVFVRSPFGNLHPNDYKGLLEPFALGKVSRISNLEVQRSAESGGEKLAAYVEGSGWSRIHPQRGDVVTVSLAKKEKKRRRDEIMIVEPKTGCRLASVSFKVKNEGEQQFIDEKLPILAERKMARYPTLLQFLVEVFTPHVIESGALRTPYAEPIGRVYFPQHYQGGHPGEKELARAMSGLARDQNARTSLLPHPDFSVIRIRRLRGEDEEDEVIEFPLGEHIAGASESATPEECRAKDIDLMPGDIVELKAHYERLEQPWEGFDAATARFLSKALTYDVTVRNEQEQKVSRTISWKAPRYTQTTVGTFGVGLAGETMLDFNGRSAATQFELKFRTWELSADAWVRNGAELRTENLVLGEQVKRRDTQEAMDLVALMKGRPTTRVKSSRNTRRRVILPPGQNGRPSRSISRQ